MIAYITHDGEILAEYRLGDTDLLDCDHWARRYAAEELGATVEACCDKPKSWVPCSGHFTVTVAEDYYGPFGAVCWQSRNYFLGDE